MFKTLLTSTRAYALFVAAAAVAGYVFTDSFDRLLFGGASYPGGTLSRLITAMMVGIFATFASVALYAFSAFMRDGSFDHSQPTPTPPTPPTPTRTPRGTEGRVDNYGGGLAQSGGATEIASPLAEGTAFDSLSAGVEAGASDMSAGAGGGDYGGSESGGGDYGGGGDFGGGGGGGSWS
ncbi:MAG: hypothetical protein ABR554_10820 [Pyrinomonadaceae bacterium]